jgi:hypothetical protein
MLLEIFTPWFKQEPFCVKLKLANLLVRLAEQKMMEENIFSDINTSKESERFYWNYSMLKSRLYIKKFWLDCANEGSTNDRYIKNIMQFIPKDYEPYITDTVIRQSFSKMRA